MDRKKVKERKISEKKYVTFTKKRNDFTTMELTKMVKWLNYYRTERVYGSINAYH